MPERLRYDAVFATPAVEFLATLTKRAERKALDRLRELANDPFVVPDFNSTDAAGRPIHHLLVDGFIIDYWLDHSPRHVVVTEIDHVD